MNDFVVKDSGERVHFDSGMQRDTAVGKILYHLIASGPMLRRWAAHLTAGAVKYDADNWMKASGTAEYKRFKESAYRHFMQWYYDERDEDHASAVYFNINGAEYVRERGLTLPDDRPGKVIDGEQTGNDVLQLSAPPSAAGPAPAEAVQSVRGRHLGLLDFGSKERPVDRVQVDPADPSHSSHFPGLVHPSTPVGGFSGT